MVMRKAIAQAESMQHPFFSTDVFGIVLDTGFQGVGPASGDLIV